MYLSGRCDVTMCTRITATQCITDDGYATLGADFFALVCGVPLSV